jgi:hypothetical protein
MNLVIVEKEINVRTFSKANIILEMERVLSIGCYAHAYPKDSAAIKKPTTQAATKRVYRTFRTR